MRRLAGAGRSAAASGGTGGRTALAGWALRAAAGLVLAFAVLAGGAGEAHAADPTGKPKINGTPQADQTLTARKGTIANGDGLPTTAFPTGYSFQWVRVEGSTETDITGETDITYSPTSSDEGSTIKVKVSFTDGAGIDETVTSDATEAVVAAAGPCPAGYDWCTTMTVKVAATFPIFRAGYNAGFFGGLADTTIDYGTKTYRVVFLTMLKGFSGNSVGFANEDLTQFLPHGTVFNFGGTEFTAAAGEQGNGGYEWNLPANFAWIDGQKVTVSANLAPIPNSATVAGTTLVLTYAENLDMGSTPAPGAYTVKVNGGTGPDVYLLTQRNFLTRETSSGVTFLL